MSKRTITLELGDIIMINAPSNPDINEGIFFIEYIDIDSHIGLVHSDTLREISLTLSSGIFDDKTITSIDLLDRSRLVGYAAQNGLNIGSWVDL